MTFIYKPVLISSNKWKTPSLEETQALLYYTLKDRYPNIRDLCKLDIEEDEITYNGISGDHLFLIDVLRELSLLVKDYTYKLVIAPKIEEGFRRGVIVLYIEALNGSLKVGKVRTTSLTKARIDINSIEEEDISCWLEDIGV